jgi:group I intron endonuclease
MKKLSGIYCIENMINGKKYIGQGVDVYSRMIKLHKDSHALNNAIEKYGEENFKRYVLVYCEDWELDRLEIAYINAFSSHSSHNGYNISLGGNSPTRGIAMSKETRKKISESRKGQAISPETRKKLREAGFSRRVLDETRKKMSEAKVGKRASDDTRKKMSNNHADFSGENNPNWGKKPKNATSIYFGVNKTTNDKKYISWMVRVNVNKKKEYIGCFKTELEAAQAYDKYVIENKLNRPLNFPDIAS